LELVQKPLQKLRGSIINRSRYSWSSESNDVCAFLGCPSALKVSAALEARYELFSHISGEAPTIHALHTSGEKHRIENLPVHQFEHGLEKWSQSV
jgi:hypothetical protein